MSPAPTTTAPAGRFASGALRASSFDSHASHGWSPTSAMAEASSNEGISFVYHGWQFSLRAEDDGVGGFKPMVFWRMHGKERMALPSLRDRCETKSAALVSAEAQAVRWVREHMGYGRHDF